ncbi:MAG TPA: hypothetical protein VMG12_36935, partial [Polyangiaceae bacterium]|nr:hypothetical protein [Polyangiaceae bacterium]
VLPARYVAWAHDTGRIGSAEPLLPRAAEPLFGSAPPRIVAPSHGQRFVIDPNVSRSQQEIVLRAEAPADARVAFVVDGARVCESSLPFECPWRAARGRHALVVRSAAGESAPRAFDVE